MKRIKAFLLGLYECRDDIGMTYDDDPHSPLSRAYDAGRVMGLRLLGREQEDAQ